ncbi:choice-of-anchor J domain-containing protein [candidate division WOR-3 bacterium]|nr:choice-of-anchor J domain-containing protein [candidate division WOR-3 bacterium]
MRRLFLFIGVVSFIGSSLLSALPIGVMGKRNMKTVKKLSIGKGGIIDLEGKDIILGPESFETAVPPTGWSQFSFPWNRSSNEWFKVEDSGHQGSYVAWIDYDGSYVQDQLLQTPALNFSSYTGCTLTFYAWQDSWYDDYLCIGVATQGGGADDPTWTGLGYLYQSGSNWGGWSIDLSVYDGQSNVVIGFEYYTDTPDQNSIGIDYVTVTAAGGGGQPNLKPYTPTGWSGPLVCSVNNDTISEDTLYAGQAYYLSFAVKNDGAADITDTFAVYITKNDTPYLGWNIPSLVQNGVVRGICIPDTIFTPGEYSMKVVADALNNITESDETDNVWGKIFYWKTGGTPDIAVTPESLYYYYETSEKVKKVSGYWDASEVCVTVDIPNFTAEEAEDGTQRINIPGFGHLSRGGVPYLPAKVFTLAIPPGAVVTSVDVKGAMSLLPGTYNIMSAPPLLPMSNRSKLTHQIMERYAETKEKVYSADTFFPEVLGKFDGTGGLRKYNLVDVSVCPFSYNPVAGELRFTSSITIDVYYTLDDDKLQEAKKLESDNLFEGEASEIIYNYEMAKEWYSNNKSTKSLYDYVIITTSACSSAVSSLVDWKTSLGYNVKIVTKSEINSGSGIDFQQKLRNFLRDKYPQGQWGIEYVLIVGEDADIPMRRCVPWNDDPDSPWNDTLLSPVPTDLYYAELTATDNTSWNKDGDDYYGEAGDGSGGAGDDSPDYHADVHLGRIPWSDNSKISHICQKIVAFEQNTDISYKKASLLGGAMSNYYNENGQGADRTDGAELMEDLMNDGIIDSTKAVTEYEKAGVNPSTYSCDYPITQTNLINQWQNKGIFNEWAHGWLDSFARKVWVEDTNEDNIPQDNEMAWYNGLKSTDAPSLDDNYPAIGFLCSCLCSYPEYTNNLGAALLYQGSAGIVSSTRESLYRPGWSSAADGGNASVDYYFFKKLLSDTNSTHGRVGDALDAARNEYAGLDVWDWPSRYVNIYGFMLYGEPSLCHFGRTGGAYLTESMWVYNQGDGLLTVSGITSKGKSWIIDISPSSFNVSPGDSQNVTVSVNAKGLAEGTYRDTLKIASNDPDESLYNELVVLKVVITGIEEHEIVPDNKPIYLVSQGWPNPFSTYTNIKFVIPMRTWTTLSIYDISGRLVRKLIDNKLDARDWTVTWDGRNSKGRKVSSGIYFVKLSTEDYKATRKLILLK